MSAEGPVLIMAGGTGGHVFPGLATAQELRDQGGEPGMIVDGAIAYLQENGFVYTLTPRTYEDDLVDEFLFAARQSKA